MRAGWIQRGAALLLALLLSAALPVQAASKKTAAKKKTAAASKVYDILLFWGQSNMLGCAAGTQSPFAGETDLTALSSASGIDEDILEATVSARRANIAVPEDSVYVYNLLTDSL